MNIDKNSADIAANYLYSEISEICYDLRSGMTYGDAIVSFRYAMALCDVLFELDETKGREIEELINAALAEYGDDTLSEINMPSWPISL